MGKFDDFLKQYNDDRVEQGRVLGCIDTKLEGINDFKKAVTEHEVKIKNMELGITANHKRIKGMRKQMWVFVCSLVIALVSGITGLIKYLKHGGG